MAETTRLIVFAKPPVPGLAKTRLSPPLTPEQAAAVYEASLRDVVTLARRTALDVEIHYAGPDGAADFFAGAFPDVPAYPQGGGDLGQRMAAAFDRSFDSGLRRVLIVGSDSPTLPEDELHAAARIDPNSVVLGRAADGGYYLVGLHEEAWPRARPMFRDIPWSTEGVFTTTIERIAGTGLGVTLLTPWYDIDRIQDLRLAALHAETGSHLRALLRQNPFQDLLSTGVMTP